MLLYQWFIVLKKNVLKITKMALKKLENLIIIFAIYLKKYNVQWDIFNGFYQSTKNLYYDFFLTKVIYCDLHSFCH